MEKGYYPAAKDCLDHVNWLTDHWNDAPPVGSSFPGESAGLNEYQLVGVDGSRCSIVNYLSVNQSDHWCDCFCPI